MPWRTGWEAASDTKLVRFWFCFCSSGRLLRTANLEPWGMSGGGFTTLSLVLVVLAYSV